MVWVGQTSGGSPIFAPSGRSGVQHSRGRTLYDCSRDPRHRLTKNQAKSSGYHCTHCGAPLAVFKQKRVEMENMVRALGMKLVPIDDGEK
jgi:transcription initiation factor IIE alpha subunit